MTMDSDNISRDKNGVRDFDQRESVTRQIDIYKRHFPDLDSRCVEAITDHHYVSRHVDNDLYELQLALLQDMCLLAVIPKFSAIVRVLEAKGDRSDWPAFNRALQELLRIMQLSRRHFTDFMKGKIGPGFHVLDEKTMEVYTELEAETPGDFLVFPVQTGLFHLNKSARCAGSSFIPGEFGLCSFAVGCIILTHPHLRAAGSLGINCVGSRYKNPDPALSDSHCVTSWEFDEDQLCFDWGFDGARRSNFGTASGFYPKRKF